MMQPPLPSFITQIHAISPGELFFAGYQDTELTASMFIYYSQVGIL